MENKMDLAIPVSKGKGNVTLNTDELPEAVYKEALVQGLKVLVNRGMTKLTKDGFKTEDEYNAAAMAKANENVEAIKAGKIRFMGTKAPKAVGGAVMTEARRLARNIVKDAMKREGIKVSYVEASEITKAANALLTAQPDLIEQAKANIEERSKVKIDALQGIIGSIPQSEKRKAAAERAKAEKASQASATQAGKTKQRPQARA